MNTYSSVINVYANQMNSFLQEESVPYIGHHSLLSPPIHDGLYFDLSHEINDFMIYSFETKDETDIPTAPSSPISTPIEFPLMKRDRRTITMRNISSVSYDTHKIRFVSISSGRKKKIYVHATDLCKIVVSRRNCSRLIETFQPMSEKVKMFVPTMSGFGSNFLTNRGILRLLKVNKIQKETKFCRWIIEDLLPLLNDS